MSENITYKDIIEKQGYFIGLTEGTSMLPLIRTAIDSVHLVKIDRPLKRLDIVLFYRPEKNQYVLHRILRVTKKGYNICGDNQVKVEKRVKREQLIAVVKGIYKKEEYISVDDLSFIKYSKKRVASRPIRYIKWLIERVFNKLFKKKK